MTEIQNILNGDSIVGTFKNIRLMGPISRGVSVTTGATPAPAGSSESWIELERMKLTTSFEIRGS